MFSRFHAAWNYFYSVSLSLSCISFVSRVENSDFIQNVYQVWKINCWKLRQLMRIQPRLINRKKCAVYVWIIKLLFFAWVLWAEASVLSVELIKNQLDCCCIIFRYWRFFECFTAIILMRFGRDSARTFCVLKCAPEISEITQSSKNAIRDHREGKRNSERKKWFFLRCAWCLPVEESMNEKMDQ